MKQLTALFFVISLILPSYSYGHGVSSATARIAVRPGGLVEIQVQFNLIDLLNHNSHNYSLPVVATLPDDKFGLLYEEVLKLFARDLEVKIGRSAVKLHERLPTQKQMFDLLKRELIETKVVQGSKDDLYTFSDRRFYQVFYYDFRVSSADDLKQMSVKFPKELGAVYTTYTESINQEVHPGHTWSRM